MNGLRGWPGFCLGCGAIYIPVRGGKGLPINKAEMEMIRKRNIEQGGRVKAAHERILEKWWG